MIRLRTHLVCVRDRSHQHFQGACRSWPTRTEQGLHGRFIWPGAGQRPRHRRCTGCHHQQAGLAPELARDLLQRLNRDCGRFAVHRPFRRPPDGAQFADRCHTVGVHDRCGREYHCDHLRAPGQTVCRRACGRRRVCQWQARGWHLDVLTGWQDSLAGPGQHRRARGFGGPGGPTRGSRAACTTRPANPEHGGDIYRAACVPCHGETGGGGHGGGPSLIKGQSHDAILGTASAGRNNMPAFKSVYSADELNDVTAYIQTMLQTAK